MSHSRRSRTIVHMQMTKEARLLHSNPKPSNAERNSLRCCL